MKTKTKNQTNKMNPDTIEGVNAMIKERNRLEKRIEQINYAFADAVGYTLSEEIALRLMGR